MSSRRAIGSFSSCITRSIYSRGASPDLVTADLNSAVTLFSEPFLRPPVLNPRAICHLSNSLYSGLALPCSTYPGHEPTGATRGAGHLAGGVLIHEGAAEVAGNAESGCD